MKKLFKINLTLICLIAYSQTKAQGCSDAGFCTIGSMKQQADDSVSLRNKITMLLPFGIADADVRVFAPAIQYDRRFSDKFSVQTKVSAAYASGNLGMATGPGDVFLSAIYTPNPSAKWKLSFTAGGKMPLSNSNLQSDGKDLPMPFQSSLGTFDAIAGAGITNNVFRIIAGLQIPLSNNNMNTFLPELWEMSNEAKKFPPVNRFMRKSDALLRAAWSFKVKKQFTANTGLLAIYHMGEDEYTDAGGTTRAIAGSEGLTLNFTLAAWYKISDKFSLGFTAGTPLITRKVRPDGLTRKFVFSPEISFSF